VAARSLDERAADRTIARLARDGFYRSLDHRRDLLARGTPVERAEEVVAGHVRRLEALRRTGAVERIAEGLWRVPQDLVERGAAYDRRRLGSIRVELCCHLPVETQIRALGATWLDRRLVGEDKTELATQGFGATVRDALRARAAFLVKSGLVERTAAQGELSPDLPRRLQMRELAQTAQALAVQSGRTYHPLAEGQSATGVYRRSMQLISGQFAMLDDGLGFSLVPWRPALESRLGQSVTAILHGDHATFRFSRQVGR
jgi:hypothetical protein